MRTKHVHACIVNNGWRRTKHMDDVRILNDVNNNVTDVKTQWAPLFWWHHGDWHIKPWRHDFALGRDLPLSRRSPRPHRLRLRLQHLHPRQLQRPYVTVDWSVESWWPNHRRLPPPQHHRLVRTEWFQAENRTWRNDSRLKIRYNGIIPS